MIFIKISNYKFEKCGLKFIYLEVHSCAIYAYIYSQKVISKSQCVAIGGSFAQFRTMNADESRAANEILLYHFLTETTTSRRQPAVKFITPAGFKAGWEKPSSTPFLLKPAAPSSNPHNLIPSRPGGKNGRKYFAPTVSLFRMAAICEKAIKALWIRCASTKAA